jgi:hypothetical protein
VELELGDIKDSIYSVYKREMLKSAFEVARNKKEEYEFVVCKISRH